MNALLPALVDTHAHLDSTQFAVDRQAVIARARENGLSHLVTVGTDLGSSRLNVEIAKDNSDIFAAVGIHPHDAATASEDAMAELRTLIGSEPKIVAVGEIGLDFYRDRAPREVQRQAFRRQIRLAREVGLPLIVHDREAHQEVVQILREEKAAEVGGVLHCFSGDLAMARDCIDLGFYISFPGAITYPKNEEARSVVRGVPIERLLVETDCPYLAPQPFRGKRNEPAYVRHTAQAVAAIKGLSEADVARITTLNACRLFGIGAVEESARIAYPIRDSLYLNITNRCTNSCTFCAKFRDFTVKGHALRLAVEPSAEEVKEAIGDPRLWREIVFCGYGESLLRLDLVKEIAAWLKDLGVKVRVNTDGQANLVYGRNILPELRGLIDAVSVSLNAPDAATYQRLCRSDFGEAGFEGVKDFLRQARQHIPEVTATAVAIPGIDMQACRRVAADLGVAFREREYNEMG
ncbi:MAG: TatD family hydrolase [Desulfuromonadales bacterium]